MDLQDNVRQTRSRTRAIQQENANVAPTDSDKVSISSSNDSSIPTIGNGDGGELRECGGCELPNNAERYMVRCQNCNFWYHFSCANVDTTTVRSTTFVCAKCTSGGASNALEPTPSVISAISGLSSSSSARRARVERELQRLEEEKKLLEDLSREKAEKERALYERELQEKLERERQYIARRHELLNQQDGDEDRSVRSMRSSQRSEKRTEEWVKQAKVTESSGVVVVVQTPKPTSAIADHQGGASSGRPQVVHPSSTPLKSTAAVVPPVIGDNRVGVGFEVKSIPRTLGSITIGDESEESLEGAVGADEDERDELPLVNLQPYEDLLKVEEVMPVGANTGAIPKINRFGTHYKRWSVETGELRKQNALQLQRQSEAERRAIQDLQEKHRVDIDTRRRREVDLVNRITSLQLQHDAELKLVRGSEANLRKLQDRERADLKSTIGTLEKQLIEEKERMRASEVDLRNQLVQRQRECEALRLQVAELESESQCLREMEQQLQSQITASRQREHEAIRVRNEAEKQYWDLHEEVQQIINRNEDQSADGACSPPLPPPPASWFEPVNTASVNHCDINPPFLLSTPPPILSSVNTFASVPRIQPQLLSQAVVPAYLGDQLGPSPQQIAARQVVTKELPIFSGNPIDWPLFISSYQHSTETCGYTNSENLLRLQRCLRGSAKDSVSSFLLHPSTVPQVLSTLQLLYGRPEQIVSNMIAKVRATPPPKADRLETLVSFGLVVQNLCGHLKAVGLQRYLTNPILLQELVDKLPTTVKINWALYQEQVPVVDLNVFSEYMAKVTSAASGITQLANIPEICLKDVQTRPNDRSFVNTHVSSERVETNCREDVEKSEIDGRVQKGREYQSSAKCSMCNVDSHQISSCTSFNELDLDGRWEVVKMYKLCARCLVSHARWPCKGQVCGINGCPKRHHRMLHYIPAATVDYQSDSYSSS